MKFDEVGSFFSDILEQTINRSVKKLSKKLEKEDKGEYQLLLKEFHVINNSVIAQPVGVRLWWSGLKTADLD